MSELKGDGMLELLINEITRGLAESKPEETADLYRHTFSFNGQQYVLQLPKQALDSRLTQEDWNRSAESAPYSTKFTTEQILEECRPLKEGEDRKGKLYRISMVGDRPEFREVLPTECGQILQDYAGVTARAAIFEEACKEVASVYASGEKLVAEADDSNQQSAISSAIADTTPSTARTLELVRDYMQGKLDEPKK